MAKQVAVQVTEPVVKIQHDAHSYTAIYVLRDKTRKFRMPGVKDESPRAWDYGPSIITEQVGPMGNETMTHDPDNAKVWEWLGALIKVGSFVMKNEGLRKQVPLEEGRSYWVRNL